MSHVLLRGNDQGVVSRDRIAHQYLIFLFLAPVASQFGQHLDPSTPVVLAQPLSVVLQFTLIALTVVAWIYFKPATRWSRMAQVFFVVVIGTWLLVSTTAAWHQSLLNPTLVLLPVSLVMILLKPPQRHDVWIAANVFAWALVTIAAIAQILDTLGIRQLHYEGWNRTWIRIWDTFPFLFSVIDYGSRWEGPFGNVNYAGPIGAFLVVFGLIQRSVSGGLLTFIGIIFLFVSDSRSAWIAALIAVLVMFASSRIQDSHTRVHGIVFGGLALVVLSIFIVTIMRDDSATGRRLFWMAYLERWIDSPLTGAGDRGIDTLIADGKLPAMATHGHNLLIDPLLRHGLLATIAIGCCLLVAAAIAWRADMAVRPSALALVALFLCLGVAEDLVGWTYLSISVIPLLFAVMIGDRRVQAVAHKSRSMGVV